MNKMIFIFLFFMLGFTVRGCMDEIYMVPKNENYKQNSPIVPFVKNPIYKIVQ